MECHPILRQLLDPSGAINIEQHAIAARAYHFAPGHGLAGVRRQHEQNLGVGYREATKGRRHRGRDLRDPLCIGRARHCGKRTDHADSKCRATHRVLRLIQTSNTQPPATVPCARV